MRDFAKPVGATRLDCGRQPSEQLRCHLTLAGPSLCSLDGQVLGQDLASGQLLALEEDLPTLLGATEAASESMRVLIRSLRDSPLGTGGLAETLRLLVRFMEQESEARIALSCEPVGGTPVVRLIAYQVARKHCGMPETLEGVRGHSRRRGWRRLLADHRRRGWDWLRP